MRKYFANRENNLYRIRNKVSFHYDKEVSMAFLESVDGQTQHDILTGDGSENLFHIFPETAMNFVLFGIQSTDDFETVQAKAKGVGDDLLAVMDFFVVFSDDFMISTVRKLGFTRASLEVSEGIDPRICPSTVIAASQHGRDLRRRPRI